MAHRGGGGPRGGGGGFRGGDRYGGRNGDGGGNGGGGGGGGGNGGEEAHDFFKTKLCRNFQEGQCYKGSACNFAHGAAELRRTGLPPHLKGGRSRSYRPRSPSDRRRSPDVGRRWSPRDRRSLSRSPSPRGLKRSRSRSPNGRSRSPTPRSRSPSPNSFRVPRPASPPGRPAEHQSPLQRSALDAQPRGALPPAAAATTLQIHRELEKQLIESTARAIEMQKRIDTLEAQSQASTRLEQQYLARIAELEGKAASAREDATRSDSKLRRLLRAQIRTQRFAEEHRRCESKLRKLVDELREDGAPGSTGLEDDTQAIAPPGSPAEGQWHPVIIQNGGPSPDGLMNSNRGQ